MKFAIGCMLAVAGFSATIVHAQFGTPWHRTPVVAIIGSDGDPRVGLIDEAISSWNKTLEEIGSGFRLGPAARHAAPIPEEGLRTLSLSIVGSCGPVQVPQALRGRPSPCRPDLFRSIEPKLFPLTDDEKRQLQMMYPASWRARTQ